MSIAEPQLDSRSAERRGALLTLWLVPLLWAVNYVVARRAPGVIEPYTLAGARWTLVAVLLVLWCRAELWRERAHLRQAWWQYFVLGTLGMVICGAWVYHAAHTSPAMNIALIYAAAPVLIAVGAWLWLGESMNRLQLTGVAITLAGVLHVVAKGDWAHLAQFQFVTGDVWMLAVTTAWAAYSLWLKRWPSPLGATARLAAISLGSVPLLALGAVWEQTQPQALPWSWYAVFLVLLAAFVPGLAAYALYGWTQKVLGATRVAMSLYVGPLYAALTAWGVLGEPLGWHHLVGALLILPGVFLVSRA